MRCTLLFLVVGLFLLLPAAPRASVVLTGTRVIYPAAVSGKTLQLSNNDDHPWLVQMWLDAGDENSTPENAAGSVPFLITPPIFRVEAHGGHAVRVRFIGDDRLPEDRESLFFLNFTQIPPQDAPTGDENRLTLIHKTRVKLFYRPRGLAQPDFGTLACALRLHMDGHQLVVENPSAFHAVVSQAELIEDGRSVPLLRSAVIAPLSRRDWPLTDAPPAPGAGARLRVILINDYGADEHHDCSLA